MSSESQYSARDLALWGLLDAARREAARDRLIAAEPLPPPALLEVLLSQWAQGLGLQLAPGAQGHQPFQGRVQRLQGLLLAEEVYPSRLSLGWGDPAGRPAPVAGAAPAPGRLDC